MSKSELLNLLKICGKARTGKLADLPTWLQEFSAKGKTQPYRMMILQNYIMANTLFEDTDVPMTSQLLNMIMKRSWTGKDGNIDRLSLVHDMDGLSHFTMLDLNEYEVALLNNEQDLLNAASLVSVEYLRFQQCKLNVCIPLE